MRLRRPAEQQEAPLGAAHLEGLVDDVAKHVIRVERRRGAAVIGTVWEAHDRD